MDLISAAAALAVADGDGQVSVDLGTDIPGLARLRLSLGIGEPPRFATWFSIGDKGMVAKTAQMRMLLVAELGGSGVLAGRSVKLPLYAELAHARARLAHLNCSVTPGTTPSVTVATRPGLARLRIADADLDDLSRFDRTVTLSAAPLLTTSLVRVTAWADVDISDRTATNLRFSGSDIEDLVTKTASTTEITGSLASSLLRDLEVDVSVSGLALGTSNAISGAVADTLALAAPSLDDALASVLSTLGISVGEADVTVHDAACGSAVLVQ